MTPLVKTLTITLVLASTAISGSAFAQSNTSPMLSSVQMNDWILKAAPAENQSSFVKSDANNQFTPLPDHNLELMTKFEGAAYSRFDIADFKYPVLGPVNLTVQADYQELLAPNNTLQVIDITYQSPDSSPFSQTPYQVATTATAQVKLVF